MFRVIIYLYWQTENKTCLEYVLDIAQGDSSQVSRTFKLQEKELKFSEAQSIENRSKSVSAEFKSSPSPRKRLGF